MLFFKGSESLSNLKTGVGISLNLIMNVPKPLLSYINLLGNLRINSKGVIKKKIYIYE